MIDTAHHARPRIGLISNRNSGHNRDQFDNIEHLLAEYNEISHVATDCIEDIPGALRQLADEHIDLLAINGGDGTVSAVLGYALENAVFPVFPPVVVLPGGTANMSAADFGARGALMPAVRRLCRWARTDTPVGGERIQRSLMRVQIGSKPGVHHGMFLGMGAVIQGTEYTHQEIHSRGLRDNLSGALGVVRTVWGLFRDDPRFCQAVDINLRLDQAAETHDHKALIVAASSLRRLFLGMRPFWGTEPGTLRLSVIMEHPHRFLRTFISIARGRPSRHATAENGYISHNAEHISIKMQGSLNLDGEILNSDSAHEPVNITASPAITFIKL